MALLLNACAVTVRTCCCFARDSSSPETSCDEVEAATTCDWASWATRCAAVVSTWTTWESGATTGPWGARTGCARKILGWSLLSRALYRGTDHLFQYSPRRCLLRQDRITHHTARVVHIANQGRSSRRGEGRVYGRHRGNINVHRVGEHFLLPILHELANA